MDDFDVATLHESRNEWSARLITILTPLIIDGYKSIIDEAIKLCKENGELDKYLMTFQNFVSRIPKWNNTIIETERKRICDKSGCMYLEDLVTCVHIIQLKMLTAVRVGQKQKKIDINVPKLDDFIHKVYISVARKVYKNVYLFEQGIPPLQIQKHNRELEIIVQECILNTVRESIPVEAILKEYMQDESVEEEVTEEIKEEVIEPEPEARPDIEKELKTEQVITPVSLLQTNEEAATKLSFDDMDYVKDANNNVTPVSAPKTIEFLTELSEKRAKEKAEEDDDDKISILPDSFDLTELDVHEIGEPKIKFPELNEEIEFELLE
jgi:hypothetical protein